MGKRKRSESLYASQRKLVRLPELKMVDLVRTGDELEFTYQNRTFRARVTREGYIAATTPMASTTRATVAVTADADKAAATSAGNVYTMPSNYTLDCVDTYWQTRSSSSTSTKSSGGQQEDACKTNPNGYSRVKHVPSGKTLNALRDEYMTMYAPAARTPEDLVRDIAEKSRASPAPMARTSMTRSEPQPQSPPPPPPPPSPASELAWSLAETAKHAASLLHREPLTVATLRAEGGAKGYKSVAEQLQVKLDRAMHALAVCVACIEECARAAQDLGPPVSTHAAMQAAQQLAATYSASADDDDDDSPGEHAATNKAATEGDEDEDEGSSSETSDAAQTATLQHVLERAIKRR